MASSLPPYGYTDLKDPKSSIRLLEVLAGDPKTPLCAHLNEASLDDKPIYTALSYVWGKEPATEDIQIDGYSFKIRPNVSTGLHRLRKMIGTFKIWIDAICINQNHDDERSAQVSMMRWIYESARHTIVYLGEYERAQELRDFIGTVWKFILRFRRDNRHNPSVYVIKAMDLRSYGLPEGTDPRWHLMTQLTSHPWFTRVWSFQESLVSKKCLFIQGDFSCSQTKLFLTIRYLLQKQMLFPYITPLSESELDGFESAGVRTHMVLGSRDFSNLSSHLCGWSSSPFIILLRDSRASKATDPRDYVFSLIGVSDEADEPDLQPDYRQDVDEVYKRVAKFVVKAGYANLLLDSTLNNPPANWPTWIPRWNATYLETSHTWVAGRMRLHDLFRATGESSAESFRCQDDCILRARGSLFDSIDKTGATHEPDSYQDMKTETLLAVVFGVWELLHMLLETTHPYGSGRDLLRAISHTSVLGEKEYVGEMVKVPEDYVEGMVRWFHVAKCYILEHCEDTESPIYTAALNAVRELIQATAELPPEPGPLYLGLAHEFFHQASSSCVVSLRLVTKKGYIGQTNRYAKEGDKIALLEGCEVPLVLRPREDGTFTYVSTCYVHGIMFGEAWNQQDAQDIRIM
ncbi:hypothetical protein FZEAL_6138 [Fusarium zealandicum]|uniref:Heterokaryon incompatibility domain-containing protein n=1 Tax=Fusarium zealandicum TaxID=1053134 RepID=A0A8H4XJS2_9HYPO|nr:hypothetical protein FZEAL_6138 [Fusarium zealandicum]